MRGQRGSNSRENNIRDVDDKGKEQQKIRNELTDE